MYAAFVLLFLYQYFCCCWMSQISFAMFCFKFYKLLLDVWFFVLTLVLFFPLSHGVSGIAFFINVLGDFLLVFGLFFCLFYDLRFTIYEYVVVFLLFSKN